MRLRAPALMTRFGGAAPADATLFLDALPPTRRRSSFIFSSTDARECYKERCFRISRSVIVGLGIKGDYNSNRYQPPGIPVSLVDLVVNCLTVLRRLEACAVEFKIQVVSFGVDLRNLVWTVAQIFLAGLDSPPRYRGGQVLFLPCHLIQGRFGGMSYPQARWCQSPRRTVCAAAQTAARNRM